jgi:putative transposase
MDAYTQMYNETLNLIRNSCPYFKGTLIRKHLFDENYNLNEIVNSYTLRSKLKVIRDKIQKDSQLKYLNKNTQIQTHNLDYAIRQLVSNIKSAITNTYRGHFKRFRLKFWKNSRPSKTIDIENQYIKKNLICPKILGTIKYEYNNTNYILNNISSNVKINYNSITNEYLLLVPVKNIPIKDNNKPRNIISLDPGLRTFMTGLSEKESFKIGTNVNSEIKEKILNLNKIKENINIPAKIKKKNEKLINRKIKNKVDELHWKTIKFLTDNFNNILLGDMSAKSIVKSSSSCLSPEMKVACLRTKFYVFNQRLTYKCNLTKTNLRVINEKYTSKICSNCGNYNDKLKGEKVYKCENCHTSIDRDINGCRNIMIKSLM